MNTHNTDPNEVDKFSAMAASWWDPEGDLKTLHHINPVRMAYIETQTKGLQGKSVADIGCGGGILSEGLAELGADVTAIDASEEALEVARMHQIESQSKVLYLHSTAETLAEQKPDSFDIVTCLELLEHIPSPEELVQACAKLVKPGGLVFFSTLNRTAKSYAFAVLAAEYLLKLLPQGTHDYARFIQPAEIAGWLRHTDLQLLDLSGMSYNPFSQQASLTKNLDVNYLLCAQRSL